MDQFYFGQVVADFYKSALGEQPWGVGLERVRHSFGAQVVNLYGAVKQTRTIAFSFEVGDASPEAALDFIRKYHQIDPRAAWAMGLAVGQVGSCHRQFSDEFVANDRFYQEFLIPYGGRYSAGMKVHEDQHLAVIWGIHRPLGMPHVNEDEEALIGRLGGHLQNAVAIYLRQQTKAQPAAVGFELLKRMPQPILLLDETRQILFKNQRALDLMEAGHILRESHGVLAGRQAKDDAQLLIALRALGLSGQSYLGNEPATDKLFLLMQNSSGDRLGLYFYALRPESSLGAFGTKSLALLMLHNPNQPTIFDPFVIAATWNLTPAEAKVVIAIGRGRSSAEIAQAHGVSVNTVRSHIQSAMEKMGVSRQAELVSALGTLPPTLGAHS